MRHILTLNAGSSSIKFALFETVGVLRERVRGQIEGLGAEPHFKAEASGTVLADEAIGAADARDHETALAAILRFLRARFAGAVVAAVGHRVVHGGPRHAAPLVLDTATVDELERLNPLAPLHQPHNIAGIRAAHAAFPDALQVACFDTAFHRGHPWVEDTYALPHAYYDEGVRRYGFHGLSYEFVAHRLAEIAPEVARGRVVVTHLGNGASMCAMRAGRSVSSTMGFSPLDGLAMGTRTGQIDPGVLLYLMREKAMGAGEIEDLLYRRSGLKGLSGLSHDMRELEAARTAAARQAIDYFVHRIRREMGAMAAVLGGLDAVVFCGGIGENAWRVRERVCADCNWLGLELDPARNRSGETEIACDRSRVRAFVVRTDEEVTIARHTARLLEAASP